MSLIKVNIPKKNAAKDSAAQDELIFPMYEVVNRKNGRKAIVTAIGIGGTNSDGIQYADGTKEVVSNADLKLLRKNPNKADYPRVDFAAISRSWNGDAAAKDSKADFMDSIMPIIRKLTNVQKRIEEITGEVEKLKYEAGNGGFPDSPFAKKSADKLETACHEAASALRRIKSIAVY